MQPSAVLHDEACLLTWQLAAEDLHPHADASRRPPFREYSDVLSHQLLEPPHLGSIVVAVSFKNLKPISRFNKRLCTMRRKQKKTGESVYLKYRKTANCICLYAPYDIFH